MSNLRKFGLIANLVAVSIYIFLLLSRNLDWIDDSTLNLALVNILFCSVYSIACIVHLFRKKELDSLILPLLYSVWTVSCFSLNLSFNIFENTAFWVYIVLGIFFATCYAIYLNKLEAKPIFYYLNGLSVTVIIYFLIYLIPLMPFSMIGVLALGLGLHGLSPFMIFSIHLYTICVKIRMNARQWIYMGGGFLSVVLVIAIFSILLNIEAKKLIRSNQMNQFDNDVSLPNWVQVSQKLKPNFFNEILLKGDIVYNQMDNFWSSSSRLFGSSKQYNERKVHDPLILSALNFTNYLGLTNDDKISILEANFDKRSETEEQLWRGDQLLTRAIKEDVILFEKERLAYTEMTIEIVNEDKFGQGEAIYTFQLPDGAVASSLSLWVNGIERKGVLTSKSKAKSAYDKIVGVEARDPSLLQWREGNRVVCRIFPVTNKMPRQFKIGITTPLFLNNNKLIYKNISIKGPVLSSANVLSRLRATNNLKDINVSKHVEGSNNSLISNSNGYETWHAELPLPKLETSGFSWEGKTYRTKLPQYDTLTIPISSIYLDINAAWTKDEVQSIIDNFQSSHGLYTILNGQRIKMDKENIVDIYSQLKLYHYTLFPVNKLSEEDVVLTKMDEKSANFEELKNSIFLDSLTRVKGQKRIRAINLSNKLTPYWQTLTEQKYIFYTQTNLEQAINLIKHSKYPQIIENNHTVYIQPSQLSIEEVESASNEENKGSNHIYRIYAYKQVLNDYVANATDTLSKNYASLYLAEDANIVTPISSLIVLETDEDYKKHGINKNENTLGNASMRNHGAVPEPFEWMLIILFLFAFLFIIKFKPQKFSPQ